LGKIIADGILGEAYRANFVNFVGLAASGKERPEGEKFRLEKGRKENDGRKEGRKEGKKMTEGRKEMTKGSGEGRKEGRKA
jgi:hypothetical protein